jgi:hypothetical protein
MWESCLGDFHISTALERLNAAYPAAAAAAVGSVSRN